MELLLSNDPDAVSLLEPAGGDAYAEMTGGADTYYEDFTTGLQKFVAANRADLVGGAWVGGADPSAYVMGVDWLATGGAEAKTPAPLLTDLMADDVDPAAPTPAPPTDAPATPALLTDYLAAPGLAGGVSPTLQELMAD